MEKKKYNRSNFHKHTFCDFIEVSRNSLNELKLAYTSKSGSSYYFTEEGVYRVSNHWGRAANCRWRLLSNEKKVNQHKRIGYANWTDFYPNNEKERLFYIEINWKDKSVLFQHKNNSSFNDETLRNASETAKRIKQIKEILKDDSWAKYLEIDDIIFLRKEWITKIIQSDVTLNELKRSFKNFEHLMEN